MELGNLHSPLPRVSQEIHLTVISNSSGDFKKYRSFRPPLQAITITYLAKITGQYVPLMIICTEELICQKTVTHQLAGMKDHMSGSGGSGIEPKRETRICMLPVVL